MKIEKKTSWMNVKCNECGKVVYPEKVYRIKPSKGKVHPLATWIFCKICFNEIFSEKIKKEVK